MTDEQRAIISRWRENMKDPEYLARRRARLEKLGFTDASQALAHKILFGTDDEQ